MTTTYKLTLTQGGSSVDIVFFDNGLKHQFDKLLSGIEIPKQNEGVNNAPLTLIIDLKKLKEVVTVTGILEDESSDSMFAKKSRLVAMLRKAQQMTITWDSQDTCSEDATAIHKVDIIKCEIAERFGQWEDSAETKFYDIQIQFQIGTVKG